MREAMARAGLGDDVYGEDPTVNRLQEMAAELTGKQAALLVPSGTMGNQIAIKLLTTHGQEVICEERAHIFNYEMAMMAHFSGVVPRTVWADDGILTCIIPDPTPGDDSLPVLNVAGVGTPTTSGLAAQHSSVRAMPHMPVVAGQNHHSIRIPGPLQDRC